MLLEDHTGWLLLLHGLFALATVALTTHLVLWLRPFLRGRFGRSRAVRRFAWLASGSFALTMAFGMALYPTYKVRVRGEYLENPSAITRETEEQAKAASLAIKRHKESLAHRSGEAGEVAEAPGVDHNEVAIEAEARVGAGARLVRWFDIKEHWSALGLIVSLAVLGTLLVWRPSKEQRGIERGVFALALAAALSAWAAAIIGILVTSARSVAHL